MRSAVPLKAVFFTAEDAEDTEEGNNPRGNSGPLKALIAVSRRGKLKKG